MGRSARDTWLQWTVLLVPVALVAWTYLPSEPKPHVPSVKEQREAKTSNDLFNRLDQCAFDKVTAMSRKLPTAYVFGAATVACQAAIGAFIDDMDKDRKWSADVRKSAFNQVASDFIQPSAESWTTAGIAVNPRDGSVYPPQTDR